MQRVMDLARVIRERHSKPLKTPLRKLIVVHPDESFLADLAGELKEYVVEELNVTELEMCSDATQYSTVRAEPEWQVGGNGLERSVHCCQTARL